MATREEMLEQFWKDVLVPEGCFALEYVVECAHASEDPCNIRGILQNHQKQLDVEIGDGGRIIGGPRIRDGHKAYWVAIPIPDEFIVNLHGDGYWVASCILEINAEIEEGVPYTGRVIHEGASKSKNIAIRHLLALVNAMTIVAFGDSMPPGTFPGDTISLQ